MKLFRFLSDIRIQKDGIFIPKTGTHIKFDKYFFANAKSVLQLILYVNANKLKRLFNREPTKGTISFYPQASAPWYTSWSVSQLAGYKIITDPQDADRIFVFDDATTFDVNAHISKKDQHKAINYYVENISKDHVANVFKSVFGYSLRVDPTTYQGKAIRKSEENAAHDGVMLDCPISPEDVKHGYAYQKLIDSTFNGKTSEDLRINFVLGKISVVYHKHKALDNRFGTEYLSVDVKQAEDVFSSDEIMLIEKFCHAMGLDFGAADVMRDKHDGQIYIVDVNKTCMPVLFLNFKNQRAAMKLMSTAFANGLPEYRATKANVPADSFVENLDIVSQK